MMKGDKLQLCSHYSVDLHSPQAKRGSKGGILKGVESGGNKGSLESACRTVNGAETF